MLRRLLLAAASVIVTYRSRLQFGGADGSTTFTDDLGNTWTTHNGAQVDTSLGDQRGLFNGSNSYAKTSAAGLTLGTSDFKIAFIQRFNSKAGYQTIVSRGYTTGAAGLWLVQTGNGDGRLNFYWSPSGVGATLVAGESAGTINTGQDYLIEIERTGGTLTIKRDGVTVASGADTNNYTGSGNFLLGAGGSSNETDFPFNGWLKDFRLI